MRSAITSNATGRCSFSHLRGGQRTFADLMRDLARLADSATLFCHRNEFYFDGRHLPNGCGYNGGVILHGNSYGIHT